MLRVYYSFPNGLASYRTVNTAGVECGAHLLNDGVSVNGGKATIELSTCG